MVDLRSVGLVCQIHKNPFVCIYFSTKGGNKIIKAIEQWWDIFNLLFMLNHNNLLH